VLSLQCAKAYMDKYPEAPLYFFDAEFGASLEYFTSVGIDTSRVYHIPVVSVEEFKNQVYGLMSSIERGYKCIILLDSLGALASEKTIEDTTENKNTADLTRPKAVNLLARLITPLLNTKDIPMIVINHIYESMDKYTPAKMGGGNGIIYAANTAFIITKSKIKDGQEIEGFTFNLNIFKSRYIKEGKVLSFDVLYDKGIQKLSGILELAVEFGYIKQGGGWYTYIGEDGVQIGNKMRSSSEELENVLVELLDNIKFKQSVEKKYKLVYTE
jgi:RecA/RadA recombinase